MSTEDAVALLGGVFERSPWIVVDTWPQVPFTTVDDLHRALFATVEAAPLEQQMDLIRAHPDLVGRAARTGTLTPESSAEQRLAGLALDELSAEEIAAFTACNAAYQAKFAFPFVICARENKKNAILAGFEERMGNHPETERRTALQHISRIAWYRLHDLVVDDTE